MRTLWDPKRRHELLTRLERLAPDARPRWGRLTAPGMLAHVNDGLRMATGELAVARKRVPILRVPVFKQIVIFWLPFPRGAPTAPELLARTDRASFDAERAAFPRLIAEFAGRADAAEWPSHPAFGAMSKRAWGALAYRHVDHHFRQFGI